MALPKVSAVMPVPSEIKNTVRWGMVQEVGEGNGTAPYNARNLAHFAQLTPQNSNNRALGAKADASRF
jgi:hypothetical protein